MLNRRNQEDDPPLDSCCIVCFTPIENTWVVQCRGARPKDRKDKQIASLRHTLYHHQATRENLEGMIRDKNVELETRNGPRWSSGGKPKKMTLQ